MKAKFYKIYKFYKFSKKGQYFSFDAIIASVIFILAIVSLLSHWHAVRTALDFQNNNLMQDAVRISDNLFIEDVLPCDNPKRTLGFAVSLKDRRWDETKITCVRNLPVNTIKQKLGTFYNVRIVADGTVLLETAPAIATPAIDSKNTVHIRRVAAILGADGITRMVPVDVFVYE